MLLQIFKADFTFPPWFSSSAKKLIKKILDPNPETVGPSLPVILPQNIIIFPILVKFCICFVYKVYFLYQEEKKLFLLSWFFGGD